MLRLDRNFEKVEDGRPLVKMSANWEVVAGRHMENPNISDSHLVTNEMPVNLHMLRPLMLKRVGGEVHGADVVAVMNVLLASGL
jgi:hypothetical protein